MYTAAPVVPGREIALPPRPGFGQRGKVIRLITNFFQVKIAPDLTLFHYDVEIQPKVPRKIKHTVLREAVEKHKDVFQGKLVAFDGEKNSYSLTRFNLPNDKVS